jgi:hypothetical protein
MSKSKDEALCNECKKLIGAGRSTKPHPNLILRNTNPFSSMLGPADEAYYTCQTCGHEWLHETGSYGTGWV